MWRRRVPLSGRYVEHVPGLRGVDGFRAARGPPAHRRLPGLRQGVRLRRGGGSLLPAERGTVRPQGRVGGRGRGGRRGGSGRRWPRVRGVRNSPLLPGRPGRLARSGLHGLRHHDGVRTKVRGPRARPWTPLAIRGRNAPGSAVPPVRGDVAVLDRRGRSLGRGVRFVREPIHPTSPHRPRRRRSGIPWPTARGPSGFPTGPGGPTAVPGSRGRPALPPIRSARAASGRGRGPPAEASASSG